MALTKDVNSYASLAEANAYMAEKLDSDVWGAASDPRKEQALITATRLLDTYTWTGTAISESQPLAFPRSGEYFDTRLGILVMLLDTTPARIVQGCIELAFHLLNNTGLLESTGVIEDIKVDVISLTNLRLPSQMPLIVKNIVKPLLINRGSHAWYRSN
jgi:hypothetical protein